jgi:hypothetical protein
LLVKAVFISSRTGANTTRTERPTGHWRKPLAFACLARRSALPRAWVRRGATLGLRLAKTHPQMKLPDFGLNAREAARLSQMKRRDEPLEQEVRGLYILG